MYKPLLLLAATALIAAAPAADLDGNGEVTRAEFKAAGDARFAAADANFDGQLTPDEMRTLRENDRTEQARKRFLSMDANGDGAVTEAEMQAAREQMKERRGDRKDKRHEMALERFDSDEDGSLSEAERAEAREAMKAVRDQRKAKAKGQPKKRRAERPRLDANGDGLVSRAEYDAMGEALFSRMDANNDGVLTKGEGRKARKRNGPPPPPPGQ